MTSSKWVVGRLVIDVAQAVKVFEAFVVGCLRTYFTDAHNLITIYADGVFEAVAVPKLEQGDV